MGAWTYTYDWHRWFARILRKPAHSTNSTTCDKGRIPARYEHASSRSPLTRYHNQGSIIKTHIALTHPYIRPLH